MRLIKYVLILRIVTWTKMGYVQNILSNFDHNFIEACPWGSSWNRVFLLQQTHYLQLWLQKVFCVVILLIVANTF